MITESKEGLFGALFLCPRSVFGTRPVVKYKSRKEWKTKAKKPIMTENVKRKNKDDFAQLNPEQREAVMTIDGPLLILAGAGSGKTSTMTHRIAHMIKDCGIDPYNILAVTFTNKAAGEMRDRVEALLGESTRMWIMTFHAACLRILRRHAEVLGYTNSFTVYDPVDCKAIVKRIIKEERIDDKQFTPAYLLGVISDCKEKEIDPKQYALTYGTDYREKIIGKVYEEYQRELRQNNAMDFDDLLWNALRVFDQDESVLAKYQHRFRYIMVDEYQDTNTVQYKFIRALAEGSGNICVVGDDDQCIYQWRGADIRNILEFEHDFKGTKVIKLERNYRSTGNILAAAHSVIANNENRKAKKLWTDAGDGEKIVYHRAEDEKDEARYVAQEISRIMAGKTPREYKAFAILYRTNAQSRTFEEALSNRSIPYRVVGGVRYYERKEIKDMLAYMRLVINPADELSFLRIINEPKRGVGNTTRDRLLALSKVRGVSLYETLQDEDVTDSLPGKAGKALREMMDVLEKYHTELDNLRISDIYDGLLTGVGYLQSLEVVGTPEAEGRIENLLEFRSVIDEFEKEQQGTLAEFLEQISLLSDVDNHDPDENAVTLMTLHSAKGLEFPIVFMPGMEDGLCPGWRSLDSPEGLEEERRLCYVGITRAKERLCLTGAAYRTLYGKGSFTRESTFLREMDPKLLYGDGVYQKKEEVRHGTGIHVDGYAGEPFDPYYNLAAAKREVRKKAKNTETFAPGDKVFHGKFGEGLVLEVKGNIVSVMFNKVGLKKLASDVAPLEKI